MSYQTRPLYVTIDSAAVDALVNGTGVATGGALSEAKSKTTALSSFTDCAMRGAITHIGFKLQSAGGNVVVNVWEDSARTIPVCSVTLTPATISGGSAIVYAETAISGADGRPYGMDTKSPTFYWEAVGDATSAGKTGTVYFKVKSVR